MDNRKLKELATEHALPRLVSEIAAGDVHNSLDPDSLYRRAVETFIRFLLSVRIGSDAHSGPGGLSAFAAELGLRADSIAPETIGGLYEYLRGFRLSNVDHEGWRLVPSPAGKRNQGLFYTPPRIVKFIVTQVLDALELDNPIEYLDLKIVDPAVGTGVFLSGMLEEITQRVLQGRRTETLSRLPLLEEMLLRSDRLNTGASNGSRRVSAAVHSLERCLYGVDVDAVAVEIARAQLAAGLDPDTFPGPMAVPHLKAGNALMGTAGRCVDGLNRSACDAEHARCFFGRTLPEPDRIAQWARSRSLFHWPLEFPEVFTRDRGGFDAVIGNPPYEILSVKESGIQARRADQAYFRKTFTTCKGKINTYRLMIERGLDLLREGGVLGFIVPATLLADSTSAPLRELILDSSGVLTAVVIPEKARVFDGVTQALLILVIRKRGATGHIAPVYWDGTGEIPSGRGLKISRRVMKHCDGRIPLLRSDHEKELLESLAQHPSLVGDAETPPAGKVHQGEINLTTHRSLITETPTGRPLIRGEHVYPFRLLHPTPGKQRLDWILPEALSISRAGHEPDHEDSAVQLRVPNVGGSRGTPWEKTRIVVGRVVNMGTKRRLKAALVPEGCFLGDMTNFIADIRVPLAYLLGLLNSSLLNWRFKATSTNNYLSAREIELLPIVRPSGMTPSQRAGTTGPLFIDRLMDDPPSSIKGSLRMLRTELDPVSEPHRSALTIAMITRVGEKITSIAAGPSESATDRLFPLLDALVLTLYGVEEHVNLFSP